MEFEKKYTTPEKLLEITNNKEIPLEVKQEEQKKGIVTNDTYAMLEQMEKLENRIRRLKK